MRATSGEVGLNRHRFVMSIGESVIIVTEDVRHECGTAGVAPVPGANDVIHSLD